MVKGVTDGFDRNLEIVGVGYRAVMEGKRLILSLVILIQLISIRQKASLSLLVRAT